MAMAITANAAELTAKENAIVDIGAAVARGEQDKLGGGPVKGALFDFHPQLDEYLKTHLFGDIFQRNVLGCQRRSLHEDICPRLSDLTYPTGVWYNLLPKG